MRMLNAKRGERNGRASAGPLGWLELLGVYE